MPVLDIARPREAAASPGPLARPNLAGLTRAELQAALVESGVADAKKARMRAAQLKFNIYIEGEDPFVDMLDMSSDKDLAEAIGYEPHAAVSRCRSALTVSRNSAATGTSWMRPSGHRPKASAVRRP